MANAFDPYREALVMEVNTIWPDDLPEIGAADKARIEQMLHSAPQQASSLDYVRQHTGFCREITVTAEDLARLTK